MLFKTSFPFRQGAARGWRKLGSEELRDMYSPDIVRVMASRRLAMSGTCSTHGVEENCINILSENLEERDHLKDQL
jgi:hypothetical protein